jgi:hypothetical protein
MQRNISFAPPQIEPLVWLGAMIGARRAIVAVGLVLLAESAACISIDGGAIEVGWEIRAADPNLADRNLDCEQSRLGSIRLLLSDPAQPDRDPCLNSSCDHGDCCRFSCEAPDRTAITDFVFAEGAYLISVTGVDLGGKVLGTADGVSGPAPVLRSVVEGQVTDLGVNLLLITR